jgi:adenine-specific DNA methylase
MALITLSESIRKAYSLMLSQCKIEDFTKAVVAYLAINLDRMVDKGATLCIWSVTDEYLAHVFGRQMYCPNRNERKSPLIN